MTDSYFFGISNFFGNFYLPQFNLTTDSIDMENYYNHSYTPMFNFFDFSLNNINIPVLSMNTSIFGFTPFIPFNLFSQQPAQTIPAVQPEQKITQKAVTETKPTEPVQETYEPKETDKEIAVTPQTQPVQPTPVIPMSKPNTQRAIAGLDSKTYIAEEVLPGCYVQKGKYLNIKDLKPYMKERLVKLSKKAEELGYTLVVSDGYRSHAAQVDLKRRKPRLAATPGKSAHEYGVAIDVGLFKDGKFVDIYKTVPEFGQYAESLGLEWGARWRTKYEPWHFNMKNWKELADVRDEYRQYNNLA